MAAVDTFEHIGPALVSSLGANVVELERVAGSVANQDFRIDLTDGRRVFAKVGPRAELAAEAWALGRTAQAGVPVPTVLAYEDRPAATPIPFLVLEQLRSDGNLTTVVLQAVGQALKETHTIKIAGYGPIVIMGNPLRPDSVAGRYPSWQAYLAALVDDLRELTVAGLLTAEQQDRIHRAMDMVAFSPAAGDAGVLLHGDLKRQHLMAVNGGLTGIIDWGDASVGDPAWDLARASMMDAEEFDTVLNAYPGADDRILRMLPIYRLLWNARALTYEYRAGGDWFAEYQRRIESELTNL